VWSLTVDDDLELVLAEEYLAEEVTEVTGRNRERLAEWESWAITPSTVESTRAWMRVCAEGWVRGDQVQTYLRSRGALVGSAGLRFDFARNTAELGYWIDAGSEGRGLVTRAGEALIDLAFTERRVRRVEIRVSVGNVRSRAVAERLGLAHEGTLIGAYPIGDRVDDIALYGRLAPVVTTGP
jgi:ribosomal-protein-serine acetyltransferase